MEGYRTYRHWVADGDLVAFRVAIKETDLYLRACSLLGEECLAAIRCCREPLERYMQQYPLFGTALEPVAVTDDAPQIIRDMAAAASRAGVGPMAAVAGAIAESVGRELLQHTPQIIVENGGDVFLASLTTRTVGVYAGDSPFTGRMVIEVRPEEMPIGICTSSGTVGPSLSYGCADAVIALSPSAALADAAATAIGNLVKDASDIQRGLDRAREIEGLGGVVIIVGDQLGVWGQVRLSRVGEAGDEG